MVKRLEHKESSDCPMAVALDMIGDHWTLLIIRNMMFLGMHEYKELLAMPEGISSNILSDRLKNLEKNKMVSSIPHPESKRRKLYYLTKNGKGLVPVMIEIVRWAEKSFGDLVHIPDERRPFLDLPLEEVTQMVFLQLDAWEEQNLSTQKVTK